MLKGDIMSGICVIFDMDGTLLDTQRISIPAWDYAGEAVGIGKIGYCIPDVCGMNIAGWTAYLRDHFGDFDLEKFLDITNKYYKEHETVEYKQGAEKLLKYLKSKNIRCAVSSGTRLEKVKKNLKAVGAEKYFDTIVGGDNVVNGKPAPDIFLMTADALKTAPENCIVLEDAPNGIISANRAGMRCIGVYDVCDIDKCSDMMLAAVHDLSDAIEIIEKIIL